MQVLQHGLCLSASLANSLQGPAQLLYVLGTFLPTSSNFFLNYLLFRTLVGLPLRMLVPHVGVRMFLVR